MGLEHDMWMPWALAGVLILAMVLYKLEMKRRRNKRK